MSYGVTETGFKLKRLSDVQKETELEWQGKFGEGFDLDPRTPAGQIKEILDERISSIWELAEAIYNSQYPQTSENVPLDNIVSITGITRKQATKSIIDSGRARGILNTIIPMDSIVSVTGNPTSRFVVNSQTTISNPATVEKTLIECIADVSGSLNGKYFIIPDEDGTVAFWFDHGNSGTPQPTHGADRAVEIITVANNDTAAQVATKVATAIAADPKFASAIVQDIDNILVTDISSGPRTGQSSGTSGFTVSENVKGDDPTSDLMQLTCEDVGPIAAPANSLTVIETPITGWDSMTNEEDATLGRNIETDAELKLRRNEELHIAGAATIEAIKDDLSKIENVTAVVIFQNKTSIPDIDARPPHSLDIVVQGGDEDEIASGIWETVAGGIDMVGNITKNVTDSQGFIQQVKFSRPTEVDIYIDITVTVDSNFYPSDGDTQVKNALIAHVDAIGIGNDLVVYGSNALINSINDIPGITDVDLKVSRDSGPPTLDNNIIISPREIANADTSRTTVTSI